MSLTSLDKIKLLKEDDAIEYDSFEDQVVAHQALKNLGKRLTISNIDKYIDEMLENLGIERKAIHRRERPTSRHKKNIKPSNRS